MEALADTTSFGDLDENDPASVARFMKRMGREMGDDLGDDFEGALDEAMAESESAGERRPEPRSRPMWFRPIPPRLPNREGRHP